MVADNIDAGVAVAAAADQSSAVSDVTIKEELPVGNYIMVAVDIDTTGRRLIDEIVQLAAYTPSDHFEQYIMPYMNLNPAARQRHQVRVISIGFFRMLKSMQTYKIIKSKSEVAALKDFLDWLDQLKAKNPDADGIVLLYHEERKFIPYMILQSLVKYGMLDRFTKTVKSFVNSINLARSTVGDSKHYSLRNLSKILSKAKEENVKVTSDYIADSTTSIDKRGKNGIQREREEFDGSASVRAKLAFNVAMQLTNSGTAEEPDSSDALKNLFEALQPYAEPLGCDIKELDTQNVNLERQNSFRPVFLNYFKTTLYHRVRAVKFRIVLAESGFDLTTLNDIWTDKRSAGLDAALESIPNLKTEDKTELVELLDSFFDPNKVTIKPVCKPSTIRRRNKRNNTLSKTASSGSRSASDEFGAGGDKSQSVSSVPDSTTKTPSPAKNGAKSQRKRNSRPSLTSKEVKTELPMNKAASIPVPNYVPIVASN
ncbi:exu [Drosophila busckii]|uniref:Exu n=1 Tax=Drosophila busckii TaxID=30019 RepID=A0A0M4EED0_DROBS|nr:maternal protein exuperantia [Drosophila busckii]ALC41514.1 exu [Drosophila busckii]